MQRFSGNFFVKFHKSGFSIFREIYRKPLHIISEPAVVQFFKPGATSYLSPSFSSKSGGIPVDPLVWHESVQIIV